MPVGADVRRQQQPERLRIGDLHSHHLRRAGQRLGFDFGRLLPNPPELRRVHGTEHLRRQRNAQRLRLHSELSRRMPRCVGQQRVRKRLSRQLRIDLLWQ